MPKSITIKDIACEVGVSTSAVSAVLAPTSSGSVRVSAATRKRIIEAAERLKYRPNRIARSLRGDKTNVFGVYLAHGYLNPAMPFTSQIIGGLHQGCDAAKKDLLLHGIYTGRREGEIFAELADGRIDGLVVYTNVDDPLVSLLDANALPVVAVVDALPGIPSVVADDCQGSRMLAELLNRKGHRSVVYVIAKYPMVSAKRRQDAFLESAGHFGLAVMECCLSESHETFTPCDLSWLDLPPSTRPTAAVCWNDITAYRLLFECHARGLKIPGDLAVAGYDGVAPPWPTPWSLTTIRAPWSEVTRHAVVLLARSLHDFELPMETVLPVELIEGDTA